jgi:hypothetical protein
MPIFHNVMCRLKILLFLMYCASLISRMKILIESRLKIYIVFRNCKKKKKLYFREECYSDSYKFIVGVEEYC